MLDFKKIFLVAISIAFLLTGCSNKNKITHFNKPALYWYQNIASSIGNQKMDRADENYVSLKSEHMNSPLMPTAIMMLAHAHMDAEEYLLANYYFDEYNKRYENEGSQEYMEFMKLKASFFGIQDAYKDQKLIMDSIHDSNIYIARYPDSVYAPLVNTLLIRLHMTQYLLNENIASLYKRTGKPTAAKIYSDKNSNSIVGVSDITPPKQGIIGQIFD